MKFPALKQRASRHGKAQLALILATRDLPGYNYFRPLGPAYLKSYLNRSFPQIEVTIYKNIEALIRDRPDCVGISATTQDFGIAKQQIKRVQEELSASVFLGGVHITLLPESLPKGVIGCIGEGEETLKELMSEFLEHGTLFLKELSGVKGIAYYDEKGRLVQTEPRELIAPLDILPPPDRDALGIRPGQNDRLYMFSSRGCPYRCKFCVSRVHWKRYREFSADYVLREIEELIRKYRVKTITFFDDLFIVNRKRLREIADQFVKRGYQVGTTCAIRANLVDDELCELLKKLNIREVMFGAESFSNPVLRELKAGSATAAQNQYALDLLHQHGIKTNVSMIFAAPEETKEDMIASWKALFNNLHFEKINKVGWGKLIPYPGSEYWDIAFQEGVTGMDMDWDLFLNWSHFHLNHHMTEQEVDAIIDEWETKCYLINLHFRDEPQPRYMSKEAIFAAKENLIKGICERKPEDPSDTFVKGEYEKFLKRVAENKLVLGQGWEPSSGQSYRWIKKSASFLIHSSTRQKANLLNLVFFIPEIGFYPDKKINVTLKIENAQNSDTIFISGEHTISAPLPAIQSGDFFHCMIVCSAEFCPAIVTNSEDHRNLSIVINRLELAKDDALNVINVMRLPKDGEP